ncbi:MAG: L-glutamate gamma-semialdehyde dehydrogenase [Candidatus Schekmanbacteria bacterium RIFCSPHIGHO2_02_FULL_38_11]|uniref:L-glutamate gamma-semialdehyde dehydrogenase n=1 Tax=Candidatus Schekmanbacteria bacterium RIFCSPLOWO2_12_FULL_38_15 TaxID=1817883 RepID=A0A1F7SNP0_9BACT|nr:MAG: L-glutamate gamma-semialdehyde dehydrogenase [Candidatus Schekmanbacteria bacterium GWA2_38_9]OGL48786.1 MAG: L-glutamate gamma-semialdehyde dehydrogenase [Candidatus Schekmanbacteria bacterium RIFCSPHIGHO2_02_FULL_38_11]OGL51023.1 MAG: L-glutamate gamma-semialdehyde dehydrogenase [Candidatus Schekmanbacteria bacterium RIFCSPLOWO2_02_FULL_38_14]OGL54848.1 MAG: L-glutamate gamma-semialdehyde dehydrogenase [Candidatus Schekmanbacteria bacterium RIFCSPLOWO2_12_FULL_38_15]
MGISLNNKSSEINNELEKLIQSTGKRLFRRVQEETETFINSRWWESQVLEWCMKDNFLKTKILRFIDVFPALKTPKQVIKYLREYFPDPEHRLPIPLRIGVSATKLPFLTSRALYSIVNLGVTKMAKQFIPGSTVEQAFDVVKNLKKENMDFTIDILGEATTSELQAEIYMKRYIELIRELSEFFQREVVRTDTDKSYPINVSIKLSSLYSQFNPVDPEGTGKEVKERLRKILRIAREFNTFVNIDMEQYCYRDLTIRIFKEIFEEDEFSDFEGAGLVVQAYLKDSGRMVDDILSWAKQKRRKGFTIRLVRGAYWDYEVISARQKGWEIPVFTQKRETDANFERIAETLLRNSDVVRTAIASHNFRNIAHAIAMTTFLNIPDDRIEFQLLYGMGDTIKKAIVSMDFPVRVYIPFGELIPGMGYLVRRLLENSSNVSFLMQSFAHRLNEETLFQNPLNQKPSNFGTMISPEGSKEHEPFTDFSKEENRNYMEKALASARKDLSGEYPLVIDGKKIYTNDKILSLNPSDPDEAIGEVSKASREHAELAVDSALKAFKSWQYVPANKRSEYLIAAAKVMRQRRFELVALQVYEVGKNWEEADADVAEAIDYLEYYASEMNRLEKPRILQHIPGETNEYMYKPRGVGVVIAPWNFPLAILTGMTSAAVVAGNTVVMKPAEQSSVTAFKFMEILIEAGLPPGVVNYLPGIGEEVGEYLVRNPKTSFIAFTGSHEVGTYINRIASEIKEGQEGIKRVIAEMGGKNAIIVDDDADIDDAVKGTLSSAFGYQGQKCSACSRAIVLKGIYEDFLRKLAESAKGVKIGNPVQPAVTIGPLIDEEAFNKVSRYVEAGKKDGQLVLETGKDNLPQKGYFIGPTIFADVNPDSAIAQEEIFGPVLSVIKAENFNKAIDIANNTKYALTGGLYSRSPEHIRIARERFQAGNFYINRKITGAVVCRQPFGGFKMSGIGSKAGGPDYLVQFMIPVTITENTLRHGFAAEEEY